MTGWRREWIICLLLSSSLCTFFEYRIIQKLEKLGWGEDVYGIQLPDSLAKHKLVDRPQRLTEKSLWHVSIHLSILTASSLDKYQG